MNGKWLMNNCQKNMEVEMKLSNTQKLLLKEMKEQGAERITINGIMSRLKTEEKQQMMLDYLMKTKELPIPTGDIILKSIEIMKIQRTLARDLF